MKIESIELMNFCQFRHYTAEFGEGLTALLGPNGRGKSNLLGGVRFALTGDNPNPGPIADNICDLSPDSETSYVRLRFSHGPVQATVKRNLRPKNPTAELEIHSTGERIEGARDVNQRIWQILSISAEVLNEIVVVAQDDIFGFLAKTAAKRAEAFQKLFHTEKAALIYKLIGDQLKTIEIPTTGVDLDELRHTIQVCEQQKRSLAGQLGTMNSFAEIQSSRDLNAGIAQQYTQLCGAQQQLETEQGNLQKQQHQLESERTSLQELQANIDTIEQAKADNTTAATAAQRILENLPVWRQQEERRNSLRQQLQQLDDLLTRQRADTPQPPEDYIENLQEAQEELTKLQSQYQWDQNLLASIDGEQATCPTCATPATTLQPTIEQAKARVPVAQEKITALAQRISRAQAYHQDVVSHHETIRQTEQTRNHTQELFDTAPAPGGDTVCDEDQLQRSVTLHTTFDEGLVELRPVLQSKLQEVSRLEGTVAQIQVNIETATQKIAKLPVYTQSQAEEAQRNVGLWEQAAERRRTVEQELAVAENTLRSNETQLQQAERVAREGALKRTWLNKATAWRDLLHKDAAPRFVAQQNLARLQASVNESLEMFQTDYRVQADEGLSFMAHFSRGSRQPAERLSEGQKVILALSFRIALNSMFAENIGALYLDEPTAYLDEHHIQGFEPVLHRLKEFSTSRGLQVVIITHERGLAPLFDTVVEL